MNNLREAAHKVLDAWKRGYGVGEALQDMRTALSAEVRRRMR